MHGCRGRPATRQPARHPLSLTPSYKGFPGKPSRERAATRLAARWASTTMFSMVLRISAISGVGLFSHRSRGRHCLRWRPAAGQHSPTPTVERDPAWASLGAYGATIAGALRAWSRPRVRASYEVSNATLKSRLLQSGRSFVKAHEVASCSPVARLGQRCCWVGHVEPPLELGDIDDAAPVGAVADLAAAVPGLDFE